MLTFAQTLSNQKVPTAGGITIAGNIGSKVSFLTIVATTFSFVDGPCDCETLYLTSSSIRSDSQTIKTKYLITDSFKSFDAQNFDVEHFQLNAHNLDAYGIVEYYKYKIIHETEGIRVIESARDTFSNTNREYLMSYEYADSFGLILYSKLIKICLDDKNLDSYRPLNITIIDHYMWTVPTYAKTLDEVYKTKIKIEADDEEWKDILDNKIGKISVQADLSKYDIQMRWRIT